MLGFLIWILAILASAGYFIRQDIALTRLADRLAADGELTTGTITNVWTSNDPIRTVRYLRYDGRGRRPIEIQVPSRRFAAYEYVTKDGQKHVGTLADGRSGFQYHDRPYVDVIYLPEAPAQHLAVGLRPWEREEIRQTTRTRVGIVLLFMSLGLGATLATYAAMTRSPQVKHWRTLRTKPRKRRARSRD